MKIHIPLPFDQVESPEEFLVPDAIVEISQLIEELGFDGANVTDHPCPTGRWLDHGGHHAHDPFVLLSFVAAATRRLRLQTGILVVPYRNPFIVARMVATLDLYSKGRLTLGLGAGYLKGEYAALGADFERRNEIMDEYLRALRLALSSDEFAFQGSGYEARGNRIHPAAVQKPHPPMYVGGNSKRAIRRAVELADGWYPFFTPAQLASTARTAAMTGEEDLASGLAYLRAQCERVGRETAPTIFVGAINSGVQLSASELVDKVGQLESMGVSGCVMNVGGRTRAEWCDNARQLAADVLSKLR